MNRAEMFGLVVRFTTILLGLALDSKNVSPTAANVFGSAIVIINGLFLTYAAFIFYRIFHSIKQQGFLNALGLGGKSKGGSFMANSVPGSRQGSFLANSLPGSRQGSYLGNGKSAVPQVHDIFPSQMANDEDVQVVFGSERQLSTDGDSTQDRVDSGNPIFKLEKAPSTSKTIQ
jgi:hypothetical protein